MDCAVHCSYLLVDYISLVPLPYLNRNIASSLAVYTYVAVSTDKSKLDRDSEVFLSSLVNLVTRVCSTIETVAEGRIQVGMESIAIDRLGQVVGFSQSVFKGHLTVQRMIKKDPWPVRAIYSVILLLLMIWRWLPYRLPLAPRVWDPNPNAK